MIKFFLFFFIILLFYILYVCVTIYTKGYLEFTVDFNTYGSIKKQKT